MVLYWAWGNGYGVVIGRNGVLVGRKSGGSGGSLLWVALLRLVVILNESPSSNSMR